MTNGGFSWIYWDLSEILTDFEWDLNGSMTMVTLQCGATMVVHFNFGQPMILPPGDSAAWTCVQSTAGPSAPSGPVCDQQYVNSM